MLFDDLDFGIRNRAATGPTSDHSTFLSELDGVRSRRGAIYLFTSNARLDELDPAFRRPGRIDVVFEFGNPPAAMRARCVCERWQPEMLESIDVEEVIAATDGLSYAEIEELRKLLVLRFLEHDSWDWPRAWHLFQHGRGTLRTAKPIGFRPSRDSPRETADFPMEEIGVGE